MMRALGRKRGIAAQANFHSTSHRFFMKYKYIPLALCTHIYINMARYFSIYKKRQWQDFSVMNSKIVKSEPSLIMKTWY